MGGMISINYSFFTQNAVASTGYLYTNTATKATVPIATDGQVDVSGYNYKTLQIHVATMVCASLFYRVEGRTKDMLTWGELYSTTIESLPTIDSLISVGEGIDYLRV